MRSPTDITNAGCIRFTCCTALLKTPRRWPPVRSETMANWNWSAATLGASDVHGFLFSEVTTNRDPAPLSYGRSDCAFDRTTATMRNPRVASNTSSLRMARNLAAVIQQLDGSRYAGPPLFDS